VVAHDRYGVIAVDRKLPYYFKMPDALASLVGDSTVIVGLFALCLVHPPIRV
jgi:hypothetical protein